MAHRIRRVQQLRTGPAPLVARFGLFDEILEVRTDDPRILAAAEGAFGPFEVPSTSRDPLVVRLTVARRSASESASPREHRPDARDLRHHTAGHLATITLGTESRAALDLRAGVATGSIDEAVVADGELLRYAFVEAAALMLTTGGRGYVPIHAAGVVREGVGLVLQGPAGAGKSTLAMACVRHGFGLLAEDVVFARPKGGMEAGDRGGGSGRPEAPLELWGMPWTQRLLPDAPRFFPELAALRPRLQANGEHKLEVELASHAPGAAAPRALAGPVVLLARDTGGPTRAAWLDPATDPTEVEVLWPWDGGWSEAHQRTAERLLEAGVLRLHVNGPPDEAVEALEAAIAARAPIAR